MNKTIFDGFIGTIKDPVYTTGNDPMMIINFSVAVKSRRKDKTTGKPMTNWFDCSVFGKKAEFFQQWFKKGDGIVIEATAEQERFTDKNGQERQKIRFTVDDINFPSARKDGGQNTDTPASDVNQMVNAGMNAVGGDDLLFK